MFWFLKKKKKEKAKGMTYIETRLKTMKEKETVGYKPLASVDDHYMPDHAISEGCCHKCGRKIQGSFVTDGYRLLCNLEYFIDPDEDGNYTMIFSEETGDLLKGFREDRI